MKKSWRRSSLHGVPDFTYRAAILMTGKTFKKNIISLGG